MDQLSDMLDENTIMSGEIKHYHTECQMKIVFMT